MEILDIIIPVRNEQDNIENLIKRIDSVLVQHSIFYNIVVIDDHSSDNTWQVLSNLAKRFPLKYFKKQGKMGKAYSILEGARISTAKHILMIDGDGQYPPEVIPHMLAKINNSEVGIVVANRKSSNTSFTRNFIHQAFKLPFGKFLFKLDCDIQSGLKLFKKEIIDLISEDDVSGWTLDLPLLHTALETGYKIESVDITFEKRVAGESKVNILKTSFEIGSQALKLRFKGKKAYHFKPTYHNNIGAGVYFKGKKFVTHTDLNHKESALKTFNIWQKIILLLLAAFFLGSFLINWLLTLQIIIGVLSTIYFIDVLFNLYLIYKSLHFPPEVTFEQYEFDQIKDQDLPIYSILCPLYKEANVLPTFLESISKLDYPKDKLDVQLLLEEDDTETIEKARSLYLPNYIRTTIVPTTQPKTKPKACNYGLQLARGEYIVIYDAEDIPDPLQLKKAYLGFQKLPKTVACLQGKLNYHNPHQNLLTRLFTAEYSLWFDVILTGLQSINTTIPLGGTSNHFRTKSLIDFKGWDPFNVTEDCDLGMRLFKNGFTTAVIDSTTLEEANSNLKNWIRQRSRWIKGYMQTYLVHMRYPQTFFKQHGIHALIFQLVVGGKIGFMFINPILWLTTISYFVFRPIVGTTIESFYPSWVFYMAVTSLIFGNFMFLYYYMIGCAKREQWFLIKYIYLIPIYWLIVSYSACIALYQLFFKPHYWEKTIHGLHLQNNISSPVLNQDVTSKIYISNLRILRLAEINTSDLRVLRLPL